jgi:hypothetical protein
MRPSRLTRVYRSFDVSNESDAADVAGAGVRVSERLYEAPFECR